MNSSSESGDAPDKDAEHHQSEKVDPNEQHKESKEDPLEVHDQEELQKQKTDQSHDEVPEVEHLK